MYNFTILERMVLESINKGTKDIHQIEYDTSLENNICQNVIHSLLAKNIVTTNAGLYQINKSICSAIRAELKNQLNLSVEINALVRECVKSAVMKEEDTFKFKKVYMNDSEKKLLKAMLYNLETFLDGLKNNKGLTKDETFVFWGGENYAKAIHNYIS